MFKRITLKNYRTHIDTTIELQDITLLMGGNNVGKSNLLTGIQYFANLVTSSEKLEQKHYYPYKHCLDSSENPLFFGCEWQNQFGNIIYQLELYTLEGGDVACKEKIEISTDNNSTYVQDSKQIQLKTKLQNTNLKQIEQRLLDDFYQSLAFVSYYHFQPYFLKQQTVINDNNARIADELGVEGANFQALVKYVETHEKDTYNRFIAFLRRFVPSFHGIIIKDDQVFWQFDLTKDSSNLPYFEPKLVSEGLLKAGAVALLCALKHPPALIMIEEIENGVNIENVAEFLGWIRQTVGKDKQTQFILTTHSPSVIRQFSDDLDAVYNVHLRNKDHKSLLTNLNDALSVYVRMGTVEGDFEEKEGKEIVKVKPYKLTELFYGGILK